MTRNRGLRPSCRPWASTLPSAVKAAPGIGSSGCVRLAKIPSAPSAACARVGRDPPQDNLRRGPPRLRSQPWTRCSGAAPALAATDEADGSDASAGCGFRGRRLCGSRSRVNRPRLGRSRDPEAGIRMRARSACIFDRASLSLRSMPGRAAWPVCHSRRFLVFAPCGPC